MNYLLIILYLHSFIQFYIHSPVHVCIHSVIYSSIRLFVRIQVGVTLVATNPTVQAHLTVLVEDSAIQLIVKHQNVPTVSKVGWGLLVTTSATVAVQLMVFAFVIGALLVAAAIWNVLVMVNV